MTASFLDSGYLPHFDDATRKEDRHLFPFVINSSSMLAFANQLLNVICLLICFVWSTAICILALPIFLISEKMGHDLHRLWAKGWLILLGIRITYEGVEKLPQKGVILAANHQSNFDIFVMATLPIDFKWISKKEVFRIPFMGWAMKIMGTFKVSRDNSGKDLSIMKEVEEGLRRGKNVAIFPEGTRTRSGSLLPFKKGAFRVSQNVPAPLYPVAIIGTREIAPPGKIPSHWGHRVSVRIGDPVSIGTQDNLDTAMEIFREKLVDLLSSNTPKV